jgi:hypothetical protein
MFSAVYGCLVMVSPWLWQLTCIPTVCVVNNRELHVGRRCFILCWTDIRWFWLVFVWSMMVVQPCQRMNLCFVVICPRFIYYTHNNIVLGLLINIRVVYHIILRSCNPKFDYFVKTVLNVFKVYSILRPV